ncbi:hypothetical protein BC835DRAFT_1416946 [Cytidiella melzeri]|nr:hypothetical protein BC835DRAFT_1416946 [Cytidiella melzeri]
MNRRNKNKAAANATVKPAQTSKQPPPPSKTTPPPEQIPPSAAKAGPSQFGKPSQSVSTSTRLRKEWKSFEIWLSARRAERDKRVSERLKELMSATGRSKLQKQPTDMASFELTLNRELAEQARAEWLKRLAAAGLNEEDWVDITEDEMNAVEAAFAPPEPGSVAQILKSSSTTSVNDAKTATNDILSSSVGNMDWAAPVPGGWDTPLISAPPKAPIKRQTDSTAPARSSPLSVSSAPTFINANSRKSQNGWGFFADKPNLPTPESLWEMNRAKSSTPKPPTPPSSNSMSSALPPSDTLWDMHMPQKALPPPTPPPTEPVSPDTLWEPSVVKRLPIREIATPAPLKRGKQANQPAPSQNPWGATPATSPPGPPIATPNHTGNSLESAHNHGYMSPLLIELECDDFPIAPQDILTDELVEESIRQWHMQAAEADIQLRKQLVSMHWAKRDWDELLGSHVQEMERNARTVVGHWKSVSDAEKGRRLKEDKQRRLAGIRNVTSGNRRYGDTILAERSPSPAPPVLASAKKPTAPETKKAQPQRKVPARRNVATVEDATSSEWEERSATPVSMDRSKPARGRKDSVGADSLYSKDSPAAKGAPGLLSSLWGRASNSASEASDVHEPKKPVGGMRKGALEPSAEPDRKTATPLPWDESQNKKIDRNFWASSAGANAEDEDDEPEEDAMWSQNRLGGARGGAASAWNFAVNAISGDRAGASARPSHKSSPPVGGPGSFWPNDSSFTRTASESPSSGAHTGSDLDGRFTPWKPSSIVKSDTNETTTKMANLAMQQLCQDDEDDQNDVQNLMSSYTKSFATSTRKKK